MEEQTSEDPRVSDQQLFTYKRPSSPKTMPIDNRREPRSHRELHPHHQHLNLDETMDTSACTLLKTIVNYEIRDLTKKNVRSEMSNLISAVDA